MFVTAFVTLWLFNIGFVVFRLRLANRRAKLASSVSDRHWRIHTNASKPAPTYEAWR